MKAKYVILGILGFSVLGFAYYYFMYIPKINIDNIDSLNKKVTIHFGNSGKKIEYTYDKNSGMKIPKIGFNLSANIEPIKGTAIQSQINIYRGNKIVLSQIINF